MRLTRRGWAVLFGAAFTIGYLTAGWNFYGGWH